MLYCLPFVLLKSWRSCGQYVVTGLGCGPRRFLYPSRWSHISNLSLHSLEEVGCKIDGLMGDGYKQNQEVFQRFKFFVMPIICTVMILKIYEIKLTLVVFVVFHDVSMRGGWCPWLMCVVPTGLYALSTVRLTIDDYRLSEYAVRGRLSPLMCFMSSSVQCISWIFNDVNKPWIHKSGTN